MKVAVIGAGFSGLLAAYLLEKEGIEVTIYEKEQVLGGHCKSITSKDIFIEIGTIFSFSNHIKELLIELNIDYCERFTYKNFIDENFKSIEQIPRENIESLVMELTRYQNIIKKYTNSFTNHNYGYIHEDLLISFAEFTRIHKLPNIKKLINPFLSAFGFGDIENIQAYYIIKTFDNDSMNSFLHGNQLIFFNKGTSELINKLSENITDIRYSLEVQAIEKINDKIKVETVYGQDFYDKVLISSKLEKDVIKDSFYNKKITKIRTNHYNSIIYEIYNLDLVTTYFQANLGVKNKIQFFYISKKNNRNFLTAFTYGNINKTVIDSIASDLIKLDIHIKKLVTVKQWDIFPHLSNEDLTTTFYHELNIKQLNCDNIQLIGSLITEPSIDKIYLSVKESIKKIIDINKKS